MLDFNELEELMRTAATMAASPQHYTELQRQDASVRFLEKADQFAALRPSTCKDFPAVEQHYCLKEYAVAGDEKSPRLLVPRADPYVHEFPLDFVFDSPVEAEQCKNDMAPDDDLYLTLRVLVPIRRLRPDEV